MVVETCTPLAPKKGGLKRRFLQNRGFRGPMSICKGVRRGRSRRPNSPNPQIMDFPSNAWASFLSFCCAIHSYHYFVTFTETSSVPQKLKQEACSGLIEANEMTPNGSNTNRFTLQTGKNPIKTLMQTDLHMCRGALKMTHCFRVSVYVQLSKVLFTNSSPWSASHFSVGCKHIVVRLKSRTDPS